MLPRGGQSGPIPVLAGQFDFNGNGEMTGTHRIRGAGGSRGPSASDISGLHITEDHAAAREPAAALIPAMDRDALLELPASHGRLRT